MTLPKKLATLAVAAGAFLLAEAPTFAASAMTEAFVANVRPNVDFLNSSSRLALERSPSLALRRFARAEATEQTIDGNSLVAWTQMNTAAGAAVALGEPVAPADAFVAAPLNPAGDIGRAGAVESGRSVAIDAAPPLTVTRGPAVGAGEMLPSHQENMERLEQLDGLAFDRLYRSTQLDSLHQLQTLYRSYIQNGDDLALRGLAVRELPKINRRIAELRRI